ncbi:MAG: hypothetical protein RL518_2773 [Pseudomonadota bacterium]|jgi:hypothetical protein
MRGLRSVWAALICVVVFSFGCAGEATPRSTLKEPKSFKECVEAGGAVLKSYPAQCVSTDGVRFIEEESSAQRKAERPCKDLCGNGRCEEIVCMAIGCPCAETSATCPQDCKGE